MTDYPVTVSVIFTSGPPKASSPSRCWRLSFLGAAQVRLRTAYPSNKGSATSNSGVGFRLEDLGIRVQGLAVEVRL